MTGRINFTPEAERQLNALDDRITKAASPGTARRFVSAVLDHIDGVFHGGQDWEAALGDGPRGGSVTRLRVANAWQEDRRRPTLANAFAQVSRTVPTMTDICR